MKKINIYFDMDGVLANFKLAAHDIPGLVNHPSNKLGTSERQAKIDAWHQVEKNPTFWRNLLQIEYATYMLNTASKIGNIFVLSKAPGASKFINGEQYVKFVETEKRNWILHNFPQFFDNEHIIICTTPKTQIIHPTYNDWLIDDRPENISEWINAEGRGILFNGDAFSASAKLEHSKYLTFQKDKYKIRAHVR